MKFKVKRIEHPAIIDSMKSSLPSFSTLTQSLEHMDMLDEFEKEGNKTETLSKSIIEKIKSDKTNFEVIDGKEVWNEKGQKEANEKITELLQSEVSYDMKEINKFDDYPTSMAYALYFLRGKVYVKK